jgi:predicted HTH transcriptional regulator
MLRDAAAQTQDTIVLERMNLEVFDYDSVHRYRNRLRNHRPGHVWDELDDVTFLYKLGAISRSEDGVMHPTAAGLLMFGYEYEIVKEFPNYFLDYQERMDEDTRWTDRIVSTSGDWSCNVYDFYFRVYQRIAQDIKVPFKMENGERIDDTPVHGALREALANCLINADYYESRGVVIVKTKNGITISNPGGFRIDLDEAKSGGISDPRNTTLIKMFNLINIGERAGSGIPNIYNVWKKQGWQEPRIAESFEPARIMLTLPTAAKPLIKTADKKPLIKTVDRKMTKKTRQQRDAVIEYLTVHVTAKNTDLAELHGLKPTRIRELLAGLIEDQIVVAEGEKKSRIYKLKEKASM